jgi:hypothetical protein
MHMRLLSLALAATTLLGSFPVAHADGVTFIVSTVATGTIGGEAFTNSRITLTSTISAQNLAIAKAGPTYYGPGDFIFENNDGLSTAIDIAGLGSFGEADNYFVSESQGVGGLTIGDGQDHLSLVTLAPYGNDLTSSVGPIFGQGDIYDSCDPAFNVCPGFFRTTGGLVYIDSYNSSLGFGQIIVDSATISEPSTFILLSTGILGMAGIARRRFSRS